MPRFSLRLIVALLCLPTTVVGASTIDAAKRLPDGAAVELNSKVVSVNARDLCAVPYQHFAGAVSQGTVKNASVNEASGMAASRKNPGVIWVHNDSGDSARVFAMSASGKHLGIYNLSGASAVDWEDMAIGPGPVAGQDYLYLGDIGDNGASRSSIAVYRVPEPAVSVDQAPVTQNLSGVEKLTFVYNDGSRDAETLIIDPTNGDLYVVSKRELRSRVYRAAKSDLQTFGTITLRYKCELPWGWATAGDVTTRGDEIIIRGYAQASVWSRSPGTELWAAFAGSAHSVPLASELQGEAIAYEPGGGGYYTTSEGVGQPIYYYAREVDPAASTMYIEEPSRYCGIGVGADPAAISNIARDSIVSMQGVMGTNACLERVVQASSITVSADPPVALRSLLMTGRDLCGGDWFYDELSGAGQAGATGSTGLNNVGVLVKVCGEVVSVGSGDFVLKDGSGVAVTCVPPDGVPLPNAGAFVSATGVSSLSEHQGLLIPRLLARDCVVGF